MGFHIPSGYYSASYSRNILRHHEWGQVVDLPENLTLNNNSAYGGFRLWPRQKIIIQQNKNFYVQIEL